MKKSLFILLIITLLFSSLNAKRNFLLRDTWHVRLGQTELLSWKKHKLGDTASVYLDSLSTKDTLFVQQYFCGSWAENDTTTLILKNQQDQEIVESISISSDLLSFSGKVALKEILVSNNVRKGEVLTILFTVNQGKYGINTRTLLGRLKLR